MYSRAVNSDPKRITVKSGTNASVFVAKVKRIIVHPEHSKQTRSNDFSLLELEDELKFDETKKAIELAGSNDRHADGSMCLTTGWGETNSDDELSFTLRGVEVPIYPQKECHRVYREYGGVTDRMICAGFRRGGKDGEQPQTIFSI